MAETNSKWRQARIHGWSSLVGILRLLSRHPAWGVRLTYARVVYFFRRVLPHPLTTPDGFVIETPNELVSYWVFFVEREGQTREWAAALQQEKSPVVLDVGANAGIFTHWIWTQNKTAEIIAFEPLPRMAAKIRQWQQKTGAKLTLHNVAVSDHCGQASFFAAADNDTSASLRPIETKAGELSVTLVTLDSVVPDRPILLAKIDVEGLESEALAGAAKTLANVRFLLVEALTQEALAQIQTHLKPSVWRCRQVGTSDYFFMRDSQD